RGWLWAVALSERTDGCAAFRLCGAAAWLQLPGSVCGRLGGGLGAGGGGGSAGRGWGCRDATAARARGQRDDARWRRGCAAAGELVVGAGAVGRGRGQRAGARLVCGAGGIGAPRRAARRRRPHALGFVIGVLAAS